MSHQQDELFRAAYNAFENAYAPYSRFSVGAAIRTKSGKIYAGCNVENVAYPEGTCAEAGAIAAMILAGESEIAEILVLADAPKPVTPCGGCRQKISEFAGENAKLMLANPQGIQKTLDFYSVFPSGFEKAHLSK